MSNNNLLYAQSGGVTAVINATACGVIETARAHPAFGTIFCGQNGILGVLDEALIDTTHETDADIAALKHTPSGAFGSCRFKLKSIEEHKEQYERIIDVLKAHQIGTFLYNGGGDSQDTANKLSQISQTMGYPLTCIGIPKTIDNDLAITDNCPGFGSVAKYVATSIREATYDVRSMSASSTKVFVMEVMGRHAGWIAAAAGLAKENPQDGPHIILFPEVPFQEEAFLEKVKQCVTDYGHCSIVVSEGVKDKNGNFISDSGLKDAFGHSQLGGVAPVIANLVRNKLDYKYHWAVLDYLQRAARHLASQTDLDQAYALGKRAVEMAAEGKNAYIPVIKRLSDEPYEWTIAEAALSDVANLEKTLPKDYISDNGFEITAAARRYLQPLILGEAVPPFRNGLPDYVTLKNQLVEKKLG